MDFGSLTSKVLFFLGGLFLGSLLNNIALRLEAEEPFIFSRSKCPQCGKILRWYELLPVVSFIWQKGRCRGCGGQISWRYPMVEIFTGLLVYCLGQKTLFLDTIINTATNYNLQTINFLYYLFFASGFLILALLDWRTRYIDERVIYFAVGFWLIFQFTAVNIANTSPNLGFSGFLNEFVKVSPPALPPLLKSISAYVPIDLRQLYLAFLATLPFLFLFLATAGRGMGLGDAKVAFMMGLFLQPGDLILSFLLTILIGGVFSLFLFVKKRKMHQEIPYVPFLFLGTLTAMFWGEEISQFYFKIMQ